MSALGKLVVSIALESSQFTKGLSKSEQEAQRFAKNTQGNFNSLDKVTSQVFGSMARVVTAPIAAFMSASAAIDLVSNSLNFVDKINDVSKANEVAASTVLNLSNALSLNGGEAENAGKLFASLTAKLDEAAGGSESAQAEFKKVGVTLKDLATLDGEGLFEKTLSGLMAIEDPIKRNALAMDLLGKTVKGVDIAGLGSDFSDHKHNFDDVGDSFEKVGNAMDRVDEASSNLKVAIAQKIAPWYEQTINYIIDLISGWDKLEASIRKAANASANPFKAVPKISDKPEFGAFNLPTEWQGGVRREVVDTAAENARKKALATADSLAKEAARKAKAARDQLNAEILKDIQNEINFEMDMDEAAYAAKQKAEKELYENKIKYLDLIQEQSDKAFQEELDRQKEIQDKNMEFWGSVENTAHSVWTHIGEGGVSVFKLIGRTIKSSVLDMLYQMTIKKWILNIGMSASGMAASSAFAGVSELGSAAGSGNIFSGVASLGKGLFDGLSGIQGSITSGIESLGTMLATGNGGLLDSLGGFLGANAGTIGNVLPFAGAAFQALTGNIKGAAFTAAGAALGSVIPGLGTALGGMIGGLVGSLFVSAKRYDSGALGTYGNGKFTSTDLQHNRNLGATESMSGLNAAFSTSLGSLLSSFGLNDAITTSANIGKKNKMYSGFSASFDGGSVDYWKGFGKNGDIDQLLKDMVETVMSTTLVSAIQSSKLSASIKTLFDDLSTSTDVNNMLNATLNLSSASEKLSESFGLTVDKAAEVAKATGLVGESLTKFMDSLVSAAGGFTQSQTLLKAKQSLLDILGNSLGTIVTKTVSEQVAREELVTPASTRYDWSLGMARLTTTPAVYKTVFDTITKSVQTLVPIVASMPTSLAEFDNLIKTIDKSTELGVKSVADLLSIRAGFEQYTNAMNALKLGVDGALIGIVSESEKLSMLNADLTKSFAVLGLSVPANIEQLIALGKSIDYTTEHGLDLAAAFPQLVSAFVTTQDQVQAQLDTTKQSFDALVTSLESVSTDKFVSMVDYINYQSLGRNFGKDFADASFNGINAGYTPIAQQTNALMQNLTNQTENTRVVSAAIVTMQDKLNAALVAIESNTFKIADLAEKADVIGPHAVRT